MTVKEEKKGLLSNKKIILHFIIFIGVNLLIILLFQLLAIAFNYYIISYWPLSTFKPWIPFSNLIQGKWQYLILFLNQIIFSVIIFIIFIFAIVYIFYYDNQDVKLIIIVGMSLIICTNLLYGFYIGYNLPTNIEYGLYQYAKDIADPIAYLSDFEDNQLSFFKYQARTHPPGAHFAYYILYLIFITPELISLAICIFCSLSSAIFLNGILKREFDYKTSIYVTFLFLILPSIQIYYLANLQAITASLFLGFLYFYRHSNLKISMIGSIIFLFLSSFVTFMVVFMISLLFFFEILNTRKLLSLKKLLVISSITVLLYFIIFIFFHFNYLNSFLIASYHENQQGFRLISYPIDYFFTRIENILEIILFFGPFLTFLCLFELREMKKEKNQLYLLTISALISLLLLFLTGAYRTGETARTCMFIYPFLLFPIASILNKELLSKIEEIKLLILIFGQSLLMQFIGFFWW